MSEEYLVVLPKLGESIVSATVVQWFKKEGDMVYLDEPLLEVSTDKVNSEIPSPVAGVLKKITVFPDEETEVGQELGVIEIRDAQKKSQPADATKEKIALGAQISCEMQEVYSPAILRLAKEHQISLDELSRIQSTGAQGRLSKRDVELYIDNKSLATCANHQKEDALPTEHIKMSSMRKAIAENMVRSFYEAPHASLITEVDVTEIATFIQKNKVEFLEKHHAKLTMTSFIAKAIAHALDTYPLLNSSLNDDTIIIKRQVNVGIAVSVDQGILVPVVKNVKSLKFSEVAQAISELSHKARLHKLAPDEVQEGTITLTNFGISGVLIGIPIIRHPEVAIIGMGAIHKKVVVLENDTFGIRSVMNLSLTFDHRVIDGMYGCSFLNSMKLYLEKTPEIN